MADPLSADQLVAALRAEGLRVVEYKSWRTNNRNHIGPWGPVHGVMIHHTVTSGTDASVRLCYDGHSSLPGPLCHGVIAKDGTVHLVGNGRANHAGSGDGDVLAAVIEEDDLPADNETDTDGNTHFYGFECVNLGDGRDPWPPEQVEAIVRASAALCRAHGWGGGSVIGHLEWQPGKVDPRPAPGGGDVRMPSIRGAVAARLDTTTPGRAPEEDDMPRPRYLALGMTRPLEIRDSGVWVSLPFDTEWADEAAQHFAGGQSFAADGAQYVGVLNLRLSGLAPGEEVQVRVVEDGPDGQVRYQIAEGIGSDGGSYPPIPVCGKVGAGRRAKIMIAQHNGGRGPVTIERAELKAQVWP
ncbi:N-acetylmuramoyl-L-alanine amidase [Streptomyces klenkii]|uniref:N-acetylmuramoyl-L-alanine amidase n=1 Tax=Streptomyces klenkii TaxID=1420899 RepID=A0A3B0AN94_9ACTN|nr:peptidoglycan recognition family protein [Streptomyces klenkii]RKN61854.1 N-acetylmuramoyl-L-alanine amidase [Streptomyces klenkii]